MTDDDKDDVDERFDRTLRNLLNTPPQPRKGSEATKKGRPRAARTTPGRRSGKRQEERGEGR